MSEDAAIDSREHLERMNRARDLQLEGKLSEARDAYLELLREDPEDANALHLLGMLCHQVGEHQQAITMIEKAIALLPETVMFQSNLGHVLLAIGNLDKAEQVLVEATQAAPDMIEPLWGLGEVYRKKQEWQRAANCFQIIMERDDKYLPAITSLGRVQLDYYMTHGSDEALDKCVELFDMALAIEPEDFEARFQMARTRYARKEFDQAMSLLQALAEENPDNHNVLTNYGNASMATQQFEQAKQAYSNALEADTKDVNMRYNLAVALINCNEVESATEELETCLQAQPEHELSNRLLAQIRNEKQ